MDFTAPQPDGWYRFTGHGSWQDRQLVPGAEAEAEIAAGGGGDLMYLGFGVAAEPDPADWDRRVAEVRRMAEVTSRPARGQDGC